MSRLKFFFVYNYVVWCYQPVPSSLGRKCHTGILFYAELLQTVSQSTSLRLLTKSSPAAAIPHILLPPLVYITCCLCRFQIYADSHTHSSELWTNDCFYFIYFSVLEAKGNFFNENVPLIEYVHVYTVVKGEGWYAWQRCGSSCHYRGHCKASI